ncbi:hypothetical protein MMC12_000597 [Toensbergia leucococca]|nr:hypothetical protein [Toensbergia leucococca]
MLDENLPTFYLKPGSNGIKYNATVLLSQYGSEAEPAYSLRHPDPSLPASKNRYAAALYDSYNPEILFGEVLLIPTWTQPTLSQEEIRLNGGVPPPPQPILPTEFIIQLYNPDQQVAVKQRHGSWNTAPYWEFEMPQQTFRLPSTSALDRTQSDPTASETTPKINFKWKRDGKLSKDLVCFLSGKSTNPDGSKRRNREPDITISLFKHLKELTLYEPNLNRVEMEDPKGLEVVLLLSAAVIRDVYFSQIREIFNITEAPRRNSNDTTLRRTSNPTSTPVPHPNLSSQRPSKPSPHHKHHSHHTTSSSSTPTPSSAPLNLQTPSTRPPPTDPRTQWELDAETARLKKQVEAEEHARQRTSNLETKRVKKMLEAEEREARRQKAEIDRETERLKKEYALEQRRLKQKMPPPSLPPRLQMPPQRYSEGYLQPAPSSGPYLQPPGAASAFLAGSSSTASLRPGDEGRRLGGKRSFFGLGGRADAGGQRLMKKQSSVF